MKCETWSQRGAVPKHRKEYYNRFLKLSSDQIRASDSCLSLKVEGGRCECLVSSKNNNNKDNKNRSAFKIEKSPVRRENKSAPGGSHNKKLIIFLKDAHKETRKKLTAKPAKPDRAGRANTKKVSEKRDL